MLMVVLLPMGQQLGGFLRERHFPTLMIVVIVVTVVTVLILMTVVTVVVLMIVMFLMVTHGIALSIR